MLNYKDNPKKTFSLHAQRSGQTPKKTFIVHAVCVLLLLLLLK